VLAYAPRLEPFGFAPLEASACGLPVVAVAEGGMRETVIDGVNGLLCDPDTQAMANVLQRLLDDPTFAKRLGANGRALVQEHWSLEAAVDRLERRLVTVSGGADHADDLAARPSPGRYATNGTGNVSGR
jgi:glycosyltransferase involved in cell wall biosynthesis